MILGDVIAQYLGDSPALYILLGLGGIIGINFILSVIIAARSKEVKLEILPDFVVPLLTYGVFVVASDLLTLAAKSSDTLYTMFLGGEILGIVAIGLKYYKQIRDKLRIIGMPYDPGIDQVHDDKIDGMMNETKEQLYQVLDQYFKDRKPTSNTSEKGSEEE